MIGVRTPFRVSFSGGSTDIPLFYKKYGGKVISTSIDKYMYHFIHKFDEQKIQIKYSETEEVNSSKDIKHPIVKEVSNLYNLKGLDINSIADIPKGSGLGSSSSYTVGLVNGLSFYENKTLDKSNLARISAEIEINYLKEPIGKQDHYAAAYGGLNIFTFNKDDSVDVEPINLDKQGEYFINSSMVLIKVGKSRSASAILEKQGKNLQSGKNDDNNLKILQLVDPMISAIQNYDIKEIGSLLTENWELKKSLQKEISNDPIQNLIDDYVSRPKIYGAKLLGAGGGGYVLLVGEPEALLSINNKNVVYFQFENSGSSIIFNDN